MRVTCTQMWVRNGEHWTAFITADDDWAATQAFPVSKAEAKLLCDATRTLLAEGVGRFIPTIYGWTWFRNARYYNAKPAAFKLSHIPTPGEMLAAFLGVA